ncbi:MRC1-like domain-containing protein [Trichoderma sp. SZMC 28011]
MTSLRSTTPASRDATPELLTPRSKLRALLATVDGSDDEDAAPIGVLNATSPKNSTAARNNADSSDSESDVPVRPRGKLAGRMQGPSDITREPETTNGAETARDRVRRMLEQEKEQAAEAMDTEMADAEDVEEEDELPVAPRRLKRRPAQDDATDLSARSPSPGLFVSSPVRPSPTKAPQNQPESEEDLPTVKSDRFKALVERKRQERLAREAEEEAKRAERRALQEKLASELEQLDSGDDDGGITDDEGGRRLTQEARPTRKASKKALEDMNRETQRMARNMQLAHEAKTRKKLSKASLFERFNFRPDGEPMAVEPPTNSSSRPVSPPTDADANKDTPPSSPPVGEKQDSVQADDNAAANPDPSVEIAEASNSTVLDKGKGPAMDVEEPSKPAETKRQVRVRIPVPTKAGAADSDDELEITTTSKDRMNAVFNNIPFRKAQDSHSALALRALAHVTSPGKESKRKNGRDGMTPGEFQASLLQKAREQARSERDRRLELLKSQGVVIQTSEERERQMQEVEDILAKAREEAQRIKEEEAAADKKEGKDGGEADPLAWDDSDDEEYEGNDADEEVSGVELSGSEEDEAEDEDEDEDVIAGSAMFEAEAEEDAASETSEVLPKPDTNEMEVGDDDDEGVEKVTPMKRRRARNKTAVLSDDEAEPAVEATPKLKRTPISTAFQSPAAPTSVLRSAKKTFIPGLPVEGPAGLSLTQIFAGTMDENQKSQDEPTQSMMPDFDDFPDSNFSATMDDNADDMVLDSQRDESQGVTQAIQLNLAQSQMHGLDSLLRDEMNSQISDMVELSQDGGLQRYTPLKSRFVEPPHSTVETISTDQHGDAIQSSPLVRRGRLRRKMEMSSVDEDVAVPMSGEKGGEAETTPSKTAFKVLQDAATEQKKKMLIEEFNRKKSKAKEMVEEQAEESEDEYAGLGGADGEDSDDEFDASLQDIIDDAAGNDEDARKLAAFYADRERISDEKEVEKLYKDITSGMLRRKRGADYDLSDSDDGGEARRRMKRRQFAKMQKALFADERVKKMAENPGNQAFLRTIEDRGSDDEMDFLEIVDAPASQGEESQSQSEQPEQQQPRIVPDSQPRKPLGSAGDNRAPAHMRRTKDGKKPSNIGEVRETLSDLLEDGRGSSVIPATVVGSDSEDEESRPASRGNKENHSPASRRTRNAVVDRISLKRNASSTLSSSNRPAFAAAGASSSSFKVPASLLRRATTNSSLLSTASTSSSSTAAGGSGSGFGEEAKIKKGAGKKSGINGFSRDNEKLARMQENERRRQEKKVRGAESRAGLVGGLLGKGSFE